MRSSSGASRTRRLERLLGIGPPALEIVAIARVVPDLGVLRAELESILVVCLGLSEPAQAIHGAPHSPMGQGFVGRPERPPPLVLDDLEGILILHDRRVEVSLGLEGTTEIDVDLKLLPRSGFLVKIGSWIGRRGLIGSRRFGVVVGRRSAGPTNRLAAARSHSPPRPVQSSRPETRSRSTALAAGRSCPSIALERRSVETSYHRTPMEADSVGGSANTGADIWLRVTILLKLLVASMPIAPGIGRRTDDDTIRQDRLTGSFGACQRSPGAATWASSGCSGVHSMVIGPTQPGIRVAMMLYRDAPIGENKFVPGRKSLR